MSMAAAITYLGVRHHSPACARLVGSTISALRPAYVLVEGPCDMNDRLGELLLGHSLPVAVFTSYRDEERTHASWSPFCEYSPEWVALNAGRDCGASVAFIDLPAWHSAFVDRENRYADVERRYTDVVARLCHRFNVDNVDTLWDHMIEADPEDRLAQRLETYFELIRDGCKASDTDAVRETHMAQWISAALGHADGRPIVVVTGGFHRSALARLVTESGPSLQWPEIPQPGQGASIRSYLVPYSFKRLDSFRGYQSGMPSPQYYQDVWDVGLASAAGRVITAIVDRLRERRQSVSTADLVAAQAMATGLSRVRNHPQPTRTDLLDGLVSALVSEALDRPLPWTGRGQLPAGTHPIVVEMVAALAGDRVGRLHPDTPLPPLVHDVTALLRQHGLDRQSEVTLKLTSARSLTRSRILHGLRVLAIPGFDLLSGPVPGVDAVIDEQWSIRIDEHHLVSLIEASTYGATLEGAVTAYLTERLSGDCTPVHVLVEILIDAVLAGVSDFSARALESIFTSVSRANELGSLGQALSVTLTLWRHDALFGATHSAAFGELIAASVERLLWLVDGLHAGAAPAEPSRLAALVAVRDAIVHASAALNIDADAAVFVMRRVASDPKAPSDLRGGALGFVWSLGGTVDAAQAIQSVSASAALGDWLAGLFALAREQVLALEHADEVLAALDTTVRNLSDHEFLVALPALRTAFAYFPPRERETIAKHLISGLGGSGPDRRLPRLAHDPAELARANALDAQVAALLDREGLLRRE